MAYNSNTRLLLQFEDSPNYNGDTSEWQRACTFSSFVSIYTDTSPHGAGTGHCLFCDGLLSSGQIGQISVDSVTGLFANLATSTKLISLHYAVDAGQDGSADGLFNFGTDSGSIRIYTQSDGSLLLVGVNGGTYSVSSSASTANEYGTGWHHLYVYFNGNTVKIGRDGAEVASYTHTSDAFGSTLNNVAFGQGQNYWSHYGFLDSIQILENDSTWTGGSYTVPGKPSNYLAPGTPINVDLTGQVVPFAQTAPGVGLPVNINVTGQVLAFSTPKLVPRVTPSVFRKLWANQPTKRLRGDLLNPLTQERIGAYEIVREFWQVPPAPSSNVSIGLAGQSFSFNQGNLSASYTGPVTVSLTGLSFSYSQGTPAAAAAIPLVGQSYSYALGGIAANRSVALDGQAYSYDQGLIGAGVDKFAAVTGQSFSFSQGSVTASQAATYNSNTTLQYRFNESNGSTTTDDSSIYDHDTQTWSGPYEITTAEKKFGTACLAMGNPGGTKTAGDVIISSPAGILSTSTSSAKRFDFWYKRVSGASQSTAMLFQLKLQNNDVFSIYTSYNQLSSFYAEAYGGTNTSASGSYTNPFPYGNWHHFRVLVYGNTLTIACDGAQVAQVTRSGGTDIWRASDISEFVIGNWSESSPDHDNLTYAPWGWMDSLVITDGDASWTGGSYTVPTAEPEDPPAGGGVTGDSANTVDDVTSTGTGMLGLLLVNDTTTEAVTSSGEGFLEKYLAGASTVNDVTTDGVLALGTVLWATAQNTVDDVGSEMTAIMQPTRLGVFSGLAIDSVTSTGDGYIWADLRGANTTEPVTSTGTGDNTAATQDLFGVAANTTGAVTSTGTGELPITGSASSVTDDTVSSGDIFTGSILVGANTLDPVTSTAEMIGGVKLISGANTTDAVTSSGVCAISITGIGQSDVSVSSVGQASLLIQGAGSNTLDDVKTYFPDGYFDHFDLAFVTTKENSVWVR